MNVNYRLFKVNVFLRNNIAFRFFEW